MKRCLLFWLCSVRRIGTTRAKVKSSTPRRLVIVATAFLAVCGHAQNLVVNGSFESGAIGWTFTGGLSIIGPPALPAWGIDGTHCATIGGADIPNSTLSQTFSVVPDSYYLLTLATAAGGDGFTGRIGAVRVDVLAEDSSTLASEQFTNVSPGPTLGTNGFDKRYVAFKSPTNATSATLIVTDVSQNGGIAVDPALDDVRIEPFPKSGQNLIINGSFEMPVVPVGPATWIAATTMTPWQTDGMSFEILHSPLSSEAAADGLQHLEILSTGGGPTSVWQTVTTEVGKDYRLSFFHSPRPTVHSTLTVSINAQVIAIFDEDGSALEEYTWHSFETNFTAASTSTMITFSDQALSAAGTHIDNIVVERLPLELAIRVSEVEICWETVTNKLYQVQYCTNLSSNVWVNLLAPIQGNGTKTCIEEAVGEPHRYYRVFTGP